MEITLEKIELVKDRTGVSYKEAKEALESHNGSVVDAIISIEESIDSSFKSGAEADKAAILDKIKELIKKGNVSKLVLKKDGEIILNLPVNAGVIGAVFAPVATVAALGAALVTKCQIEVVKDNGEIVDISEFTMEKFGDFKQKSAEVYGDVKVKAEDAYANVKSKVEESVSKKSDAVEDFVDDLEDMFDEDKDKL